MMKLKILLIAFFVLAGLSSCSDFPEGHTASLGGVRHKPGYNLPFQNCTGCHGQNLQGGEGPSCYACHDRL
ncbi:MAG: hypothetical protein OEY59_08395 [Deltaproteobacteria bacterium]|nr:hypothetical protein [Deltaproteobacteria bacterium]